MSRNKWESVTLDPSNSIGLQVRGIIRIRFGPAAKGRSRDRDAVYISNFLKDALEIKFSWHEMPARRKGKTYDLKAGGRKRFEIPPLEEFTVLWRTK